MTTYWVSNLADGNDANPGTEASPKANLHAVTMADGDTLNVKGGGAPYNRHGSTYTYDVIARAGITIQRWTGFPKPVITHTGGGGFGRALGVGGGGSATVTISGIIFDTTDEGGLGSAGSATANVVVSDCEFYDCGLANDVLVTGSSIVIGTGTPIASLRVLDTIVENSGRANIFGNVTGTYEVGRCTISGAGLANPGGNTGDNVECGVTPYLYWVHNNTITHTKNAKQFVQQSGGTLAGTAVIEDNTFVGPSTGSSFKGLYIETRAIVRRNRMTTAGIAMNLQGGGTVYSNLVVINGDGWGSGVGTVYLLNNLATTQYCHNNTVVLLSGSSQDVAISAFTASTGTYDIQNNIIVGAWPAGVKRRVADSTENYNCIFGATEESIDHGNTPISTGANTITSDPLLDAGYKPLVSSPCIGTGAAIGGILDLAGKPFRAPTMMGAYESRGGQTITASSGTVVPSRAVPATGTSATFSAGTISPNNADEVPLLGEQTAFSAGTVSPSYSRALVGSAMTFSAGTPTVDLRPTNITGQAVTIGQGTISPSGNSVTAHLSGVEMTFFAGNVQGGIQNLSGISMPIGQGVAFADLHIPLLGIEIGMAQGFISPSQDAVDAHIQMEQGTTAAGISVELVGEEMVFEQGTLAITGDSFAALTGSAMTIEQGTTALTKEFPLAGTSLTFAQQNMGAPGGVTLTGIEMAFSAGEIFTTNDRTHALTGQSMAIQDGLLFASPLAFVTGEELVFSAQEIGPREVVLTGMSIDFHQGRIAVPVVEIPNSGGYSDFGTLAELRAASKRRKKLIEPSEPMEDAPSDPRIGVPKQATTEKVLDLEIEKIKREKERKRKRKKALEELLL